MVYCGKASQGCQNCRIRRIKCDKVRPECSQCIRVEKKCPGYRDQLSLMFRDESTKVMQKAHAQWGGSSPNDAVSTGSPSSPSTRSWGSPPSPVSPSTEPTEQRHQKQQQMVQMQQPDTVDVIAAHLIPQTIGLTLEQRGLDFYISRYLLNHPDAPKTSEERAIYLNGADAIQNTMTAVGLASLSNMQGSKEISIAARQKYVTALRQVGQLIAKARYDPMAVLMPVRTIVSLALFEVVQARGSPVSAGTANTHITGAIALLRTVLPTAQAPNGGARGVLQLMFSMFIPSQMTNAAMPPAFFECLKICQDLLVGEKESCCVDLAIAITKLLELLPRIKAANLVDGQPATDTIIQQLLAMHFVFDRLEVALFAAYPFDVRHTKFWPDAFYRGQWHAYNEIWSARIWNHFRWARILLEETLVKLADQYPASVATCLTRSEKARCYAILSRMAEDVVISVPAHWRHPSITVEEAKMFEPESKGGSGAVGVPSLLWQLVVAGCSPGVQPELFDFVHNIMVTVWKSLGMNHAFSLAEVLRKHRVSVEKDQINHLVKIEDEG